MTLSNAASAMLRLTSLHLERLFTILIIVGMGFVFSSPANARADDSAMKTAYVVGGGDVLEVKVYNEEGLSGKYTVGSKGGIDMPLVGSINIGGKTVEQVSVTLTRVLASDFLVDPQVTVTVATFSSQPVQVLGGVRKPGTFHLSGPTTLLDMLAQAGGVSPGKSGHEVQIKRKGNESVIVNLQNLMTEGEGNLNLEAGDVVFVSEGEFVYVSGQVSKPGSVLYRQGLTVTQALTACGGASKTANLRKGTILRDGEKLEVNFHRIIRGRDQDVDVEVGDQIYVDESVF